MDERDLPSFDVPDQDENPARILRQGNTGTETIDLNHPFSRPLTESGSFDLSQVRGTSLGKLLNAVPLPALIVNHEQRITFLNESFRKVMGGDGRGILNRSFLLLFPDPDQRLKMQEVFQRIVAERKPIVAQGLMQFANRRLWCRLSARSVRLGSERFILILIEDLTHERREILLNEKFRRLANAVPIGIAEFKCSIPAGDSIDASEVLQQLMTATLSQANNEFARLHGYESAADLKEKPLRCFLASEQGSRSIFDEWFQRGFRIASAEVKEVNAQGEVRYAENILVGEARNKVLSGFWLIKRDRTERRVREQSVAQSEMRFRQIYDNSPVMKHSIDRGGIVRNVNYQWLDEMGYSREEVVGRGIADFLTVESAAKAFSFVLPRFWNEGSVRNVPYQYVRKDGTIIDVLLDSIAVDDPEWGQVSLSTVRNITDQKKAEEEAARMKSLLTSIVQYLPTAVFLKDSDRLTYILWNRACEDLFGYPQDEVIGQTAFEFFPLDQATRFRDQDREVLQSSKLLDIAEESVDTKHKGPRVLHTRKLPIVDDDGEARYLLGISEDITESKQAETELVRAREAAAAEAAKLRTVIETMDSGVVLADADGIISDVNSWFLQRVGLKKEDVLGKSLWGFHKEPEAIGRLEALVEESRSGGRTKGIVTRRELAGMQVLLRAQPIFEEGAYKGVLLNVTDVSDLIEARLAAESANKAKSEFLASMSHEIRTPMHGIIGMTELALQTHLTNDQRQYLETIRMSADSLLQLVNDILDFSKIEADRFELERIQFSLKETIAAAMQPLAVQAHAKQLELVLHVASDVPDSIIGDPGRLRQVIINLVGNAIKFTDSGDVVVEVEKDFVVDQEVALHFCVSDTGIGIPDSQLGEIFSAFTQVDTGLSRKYGGTGLGLAITKKLVAMMNGRTWAESRMGEGSRFHFTGRFSLAEDSLPTITLTPRADLHNLAILVIDDNATNRQVLEEVLKGYRMRPVSVESGEAALEKLREIRSSGDNFPLIIVDAQMPGMDGFTFVEKMERLEKKRESTIMMLTSMGRSEDVRKCKELGIAAYLWKPIKPWELLQAIQAALGLSENGRAGEALVTQHVLQNVRPRLSILLVEDNKVNQTLAIRILEGDGHRVTLASNGKEALEVLQGKRFDIILMDVEMPIMSGLEATRIIREREKLGEAHTPILAMTAHSMKGDRERCLGAGMDGYLSKPVRIGELRAALEKYSLTALDDVRAPILKQEQPQVVDRPALMNRVGGDEALLKELVELFVSTCPDLMAEVTRALALEDLDLLVTATHTLKGCIGNFEADTTFRAIANLEKLARDGDKASAERAWGTVREEIERLTDELESIAREIKP
jgi:two-component system, sensor histidine kinase and response regulator